MTNRTRVQPYIGRELRRKLRAYADAENLTESAVAEAALTDFLSRGAVDESLLLRRLDALGGELSRVQRDLDVLSGALTALVRYLFLAAPPAPTPEARRRSSAMYEGFLKTIAEQLEAGVRLVGEVSRAGSRARGESAAPLGGEGGGKENSAAAGGERVR